ncbi:hypothetical protein Tco_0379627 [Tanacetum coccineum]
MVKIHIDKNVADLLTKAFEATVKVKTVNGEVQLQALVDEKKIIITESIVRRNLQLEDAEGVDRLPNAIIFEQLTLIGSKTTAWNEFSSAMASIISCLATNQKFNFSKYIFESMEKNLDNVGKFLMYPRFVQVFLDKQLEGMATHDRMYIAPSHTKKIFRNMKRVKVQHHTPTIIQPSSSQPQKTQKPRRPKRKDTEVPHPSGPTTNVADKAVNEEMDGSLKRVATTAASLDADRDIGNINKTRSKETLNEPSYIGTSSGSGPKHQETMRDIIAQTRFENISKTSNDPLLARGNTLQSGKDSLKLNELMELCTNLQQRVLDLEQTKTTQAEEIVGSSRRVESSDDEGLGEEDASKQRRIADIDANKYMYLVNVHNDEDMFGVNDLDVSTASTIPVSAATTTTTTTVITDDEITLAKALAELKSTKLPTQGIAFRKPSESITITPTLTTTAAITITAASTRPKDKEIVIHEQEQAPTPIVSSQQPPTRAQQRSIMCTYLKKHGRMEAQRLEEQVLCQYSRIQKVDDVQEITEVDDDQEAAKIKELIEIVLDEEEVAIDAIPLAVKSPSIIDWKIHKEGKKSYYQIIRADGSSKMPEEGYKRVLWGDLKVMFEPHVEDTVWRNQQDYRVLDWKIYDSCRVHSLRMQHVLIHMLVEKRYPLTPARITDMLNKKLQCDHFSEMVYQLLKLLIKQLKNQRSVWKHPPGD